MRRRPINDTSTAAYCAGVSPQLVSGQRGSEPSPPRRLTDGMTPSFFPDGRSIALARLSPQTGRIFLSRLALDGSQAPVLLAHTGNTYTLRYFTLGSYSSGPVTITLIPGSIGAQFAPRPLTP